MNWKTLPMLGAVAGLALGLGVAEKAEAGCSDQGYIGSVCFMASTYCPDKFIAANGQVLQITQFQALYALMGTAYGGDGRTDMQVPDLRSRTAVGVGNATVYTSQVNRGTKRGFEKTTLVDTNMPVHSHAVPSTTMTITGTLKANTGAGSTDSPTGNYPAKSNLSQALNFTKGALDTTFETGILTGTISTPPNTFTTAAGASQPFDIIGPRLGLVACIRVDGLFPPRP